MKRFEYGEGCMDEDEHGEYVLYKGAADLQRQLAAVTAERDAWKNTHDNLRAVYHDIGEALGAVMPAQLVNDVARRRMEQLAIATVLVRDQMDEIKRLNVELDAAHALISEVEHDESGLPKGARYAIEWYRKGRQA